MECDRTCNCDATFECLRHACLDNDILAAADYTKQFCVASDASDDDKGVQLYQLRGPTSPDILNDRDTVSYYTCSKQWSASMAKWPSYYKKADVRITALTLARPYADASPLPILAYTDRSPL